MENIEHFDKLGHSINVGDYVAYPNSNMLELGMIVKLNPKMIKIQRIAKKPSKYKWRNDIKFVNKYSKDCIIVDNQLITLYLLKNV